MSIATSNNAYAGEKQPSATAVTRFRFRITLEGMMLLIVIMLVGFAAWHSGTNLLYLIFSILIALYLVHGFLMSVNLNQLRTGESIPETVVAGQPFDVGATLTNGKKYSPTNAIRVEHRLNNGAKPLGAVYFSTIPARQSREGYYTAAVPRRGLHIVNTAVISTRYPFGFEERLQLRSIQKKVLALPHTYSVSAIADHLPFGFGDQDSQVRGTGTELYGLREYVPGEHARHVHWRTSARAQKVMIAEFTRDERKQVILLLNNSIQPELKDTALEESFENAVTFTASLAKHLINTGFEVGLITSQARIPVGQGPSHLIALLRHLAVIQLVDPSPIAPVTDPVLQVTYHNFASPADNGQNTIVIDSTKWHPPIEELVQGEKHA